MLADNNLQVLRESNNLTRLVFSEKYNIEEETLKSYERGKRKLPVEIAIKIANDFGVTLDWLFCRTEHKNEKDAVTQILYSLGKIFKITRRKNHNGDDVVLLMDYRFRNFLCDINKLIIAQVDYLNAGQESLDILLNEKYKEHRKYLEAIFSDIDFNQETSLEIHSVESMTYILSVLGEEDFNA